MLSSLLNIVMVGKAKSLLYWVFTPIFARILILLDL